MNYMDIYKDDTINGEDYGVVLFVAGCDLYCENGTCQNTEAYDFNGGKPFTKETIAEIYQEFDQKPYLGRLTISGGNPTSGCNPNTLIPFLKQFKNKYPDIVIWLYSGHTWEELRMDMVTWNLIHLVDVLVDGRWVKALEDPNTPYAGSSNQRLIDVQKSLSKGEVVLYEVF